MNAYSLLGVIITLIPMTLIATILIKRGKKIFDSE